MRLEPMRPDHYEGMCSAGLFDDLWRLTTVHIRTPDDMREYMNAAFELQRSGSALPFVTIAQSTNQVIGSTRFGNIDAANHRVEVGWTWLTPAWQRTGANIEAKLLMLQHAFEELGCIRVEFKTDSRNEKSRNALRGIGAQQEGLFRNHMIVPNWRDAGDETTPPTRYRDSVYFSIINSEWPDVKERLIQRLRA